VSIKNYVKRNPLIKKLRRLLSGYKAIKEANNISQHFLSFFTPVLAQTEDEVNAAFKVRHNVFCEELKLFKIEDTAFEKDGYDEYAKQCVIKHQRTQSYAGTVRMIMPSSSEQTLPIEKIALAHITQTQYLPSNFNRDEVCEISRIAIDKSFRRRNLDKYDGAATAVINEETYSEIELRCFPLLAVGLYMATAAVCISQGKKHAYFMVEPRLAKSMSYIGIKLVKIGNEFEYVGTRAPYYINNEDFVAHLSPPFKSMMNAFTEIMNKPKQIQQRSV